MWKTVFTRITSTLWPTAQSDEQPNNKARNANNKRERDDSDDDSRSIKRTKTIHESEHDCIKCSYLSVELSDMKETLTSIQSLHQSSLCAICQHLLIEPVTLDCSHSFCSMCCLKALRRTKQCPLCRSAVERPPQKPSIQLKGLLSVLSEMSAPEEQNERVVEEATRVRAQVIDGVKVEQQLSRLFDNRRLGLQRRAPIFDESDNVWRCPYCAFELVEGADCCSPLDWSAVADEVDAENLAAAEDEDIEANEDVDLTISDDYDSDLGTAIRGALQQAERRRSDITFRSGINLHRIRRRDSVEDELDGGVREVFRVMFNADEHDVHQDDASDENVELPNYIDDEAQEIGMARPSQQSYADFLDSEAQFSDTEEFSDGSPRDEADDDVDDFEAEFESQFQQYDSDDEAEYQYE